MGRDGSGNYLEAHLAPAGDRLPIRKPADKHMTCLFGYNGHVNQKSLHQPEALHVASEPPATMEAAGRTLGSSTSLPGQPLPHQGLQGQNTRQWRTASCRPFLWLSVSETTDSDLSPEMIYYGDLLKWSQRQSPGRLVEMQIPGSHPDLLARPAKVQPFLITGEETGQGKRRGCPRPPGTRTRV